MCTTSGAVCGGYKRMLERKKRQSEPTGKKEWSDGGQKGLVHPSDKIVLPMDKRLSMGNCYDEHTKEVQHIQKGDTV